MTTTAINNIHNLKHFKQIQTLLNIEDLEVFATEINFLYEKLEQYAAEIDAAVKNCKLMKAAINDYENERQYLMDKIAEMQGTTNIYVFDKEDEYNDIQIQQEQEQEKEQQEQADIIDIFNNIYKQEKQEQEEYNTIPEHFININENIIIEEKKELSKEEILKTVIVNYDEEQEPQEEQEQQKETYIFNNNGMYDYNIKNDDEYIKRMNDKSPLNKYNTFEDYINNFSIYDKDNKKAVKKAIVEDFKKAGFKVKANNGYYNSLNIILEIKKEDIIDNNVYDKAKKDLYDLYHWQELLNCYNLNLNRDINLTDKENIDTIKSYFEERINKKHYNRYETEKFNNDKDKKDIIELFYKDDVLNNIKKNVKNILFKYSILKSYDAYSDYNSTYRTFDFDFYIKLI